MEESKNIVAPTTPAAAAGASAPAHARSNERGANRGGQGGGQRRSGGQGGRKSAGRERSKPEFDSATLEVRRVARVMGGGRRFSFSVAIVAGNRRGLVGVGLGKAGDTALAIDKAMRDAKKRMVKINTTKTMSIPHQSIAKYSSATVMIQPAHGRGMVAGSAARVVLELAGIKNVVAKIQSPSKNKLSIARATVEALKGLYLVRPTGSVKK